MLWNNIYFVTLVENLKYAVGTEEITEVPLLRMGLAVYGQCIASALGNSQYYFCPLVLVAIYFKSEQEWEGE